MSKKTSKEIVQATVTGAEAHVDLLGKEVKDRVSGFEGTVVTVSFDLFGCIQAIVKPPVDKDGKLGDGHWFDIHRLEVTNHKRCMDRPLFRQTEYGATPETHQHGPADKPKSRNL